MADVDGDVGQGSSLAVGDSNAVMANVCPWLGSRVAAPSSGDVVFWGRCCLWGRRVGEQN